jgi:hypothetical protein
MQIKAAIWQVKILMQFESGIFTPSVNSFFGQKYLGFDVKILAKNI